MIPISVVLLILFAHFVGDWLLQTRWMALNKSSNLKVLLIHLANVAVPLFLVSLFFFPWQTGLLWVGINILCHGLQDWNIWTLAGRWIRYRYGDEVTKENVYQYADFWNVVGLDQFLHFLIYFMTIPLVLAI